MRGMRPHGLTTDEGQLHYSSSTAGCNSCYISKDGILSLDGRSPPCTAVLVVNVRSAGE